MATPPPPRHSTLKVAPENRPDDTHFIQENENGLASKLRGHPPLVANCEFLLGIFWYHWEFRFTIQNFSFRWKFLFTTGNSFFAVGKILFRWAFLLTEANLTRDLE